MTRELAECLPDPLDPALEAESARIRAALECFLMKQSPDARRLFMRRYFYAQSIAQLADETGLTQSVVTSRLYRMREALRKQLEREGIDL